VNVAIICSNLYDLNATTIKGTEIFTYDLINNLDKYGKRDALKYTVFCSGGSQLPFKIESLDRLPSSSDPQIIANGKHIIFELALISKAFTGQTNYDLFHVNIGDGDIIMPFTPFIDRPVLITLHHIYDADYTRKYFSYFNLQHNVSFVSISDAQRRILPGLNYAATIHHGIDLQEYAFNPQGGKRIIWAGRLIPEKGPDIAIEVAEKTSQEALLFGIVKKEHEQWVERDLLSRVFPRKADSCTRIEFDQPRSSLIPFIQDSRLFIFPISAEEAFGLVLIESLACGTPVVAYARGAVPEIVKDGITGFLVNPSDEDIRGDWIIRQSGPDGLCEAVERIAAMPGNQYRQMRAACRASVEEHFSIQRMIGDYESLYIKLIQSWKQSGN
jgi:glycosyltransferase involved in cell wall biosynthesis